MKGNRSILLVDDDADFLEANRIVLEKAGFTVHMARNSGEALEAAIRHLPRVAVLDVMMDHPDEGFALARALRQDERTRGIRLVLLSSVNAVNRRKGLAFRFSDQDRDEQWLPVDKVLDKPVRARKLISILEELLENPS